MDPLQTIYESEILQEGLLDSALEKVRQGLAKGGEIIDIVRDPKNLAQFITIAALFSSLATMQKINTMYQKHPEILQQHSQLVDNVVHTMVHKIAEKL